MWSTFWSGIDPVDIILRSNILIIVYYYCFRLKCRCFFSLVKGSISFPAIGNEHQTHKNRFRATAEQCKRIRTVCRTVPMSERLHRSVVWSKYLSETLNCRNKKSESWYKFEKTNRTSLNRIVSSMTCFVFSSLIISVYLSILFWYF